MTAAQSPLEAQQWKQLEESFWWQGGEVLVLSLVPFGIRFRKVKRTTKGLREKALLQEDVGQMRRGLTQASQHP